MGSLVFNWILLSTLLHNLEDVYKSFVSLTLQNIKRIEPDLNIIIFQLFNEEQQQTSSNKLTALLTKKKIATC